MLNEDESSHSLSAFQPEGVYKKVSRHISGIVYLFYSIGLIVYYTIACYSSMFLELRKQKQSSDSIAERTNGRSKYIKREQNRHGRNTCINNIAHDKQSQSQKFIVHPQGDSQP